MLLSINKNYPENTGKFSNNVFKWLSFSLIYGTKTKVISVIYSLVIAPINIKNICKLQSNVA